MAQFMFLVTVSQPQLGARLINGCTAVLVNSTTTTLAKLDAALALGVSNVPDVGSADDTEADFYQNGPSVPANYFDTAVAVSASGGEPASGDGNVDGDAWVFIGPAATPVYVPHTAYTPAT